MRDLVPATGLTANLWPVHADHDLRMVAVAALRPEGIQWHMARRAARVRRVAPHAHESGPAEWSKRIASGELGFIESECDWLRWSIKWLPLSTLALEPRRCCR